MGLKINFYIDFLGIFIQIFRGLLAFCFLIMSDLYIKDFPIKKVREARFPGRGRPEMWYLLKGGEGAPKD